MILKSVHRHDKAKLLTYHIVLITIREMPDPDKPEMKIEFS